MIIVLIIGYKKYPTLIMVMISLRRDSARHAEDHDNGNSSTQSLKIQTNAQTY